MEDEQGVWGVSSDVDFDETHPMHEKHPQHPDYHEHRSHHPHADNIRAILVVYLAVVLLITISVGLLTNRSEVFLFFSPAILLALFGIGLINSDHFDIRFLGLALILLIVFVAVAFATWMTAADVPAMVGANLLLGALLLIVLGQSYEREPSVVVELHAEEQDIPDLVKTIEDRAKAINFVIGRVYSVHHGSSKGLRDKLKIDSDWYNELTEALEDPEENRNIIVGALEKIKRRLVVLEQRERDVFTDAELGKLKKLERDGNGKDAVIDVLEANDSDPVKGFHQAALEYCQLLLERLSA